MYISFRYSKKLNRIALKFIANIKYYEFQNIFRKFYSLSNNLSFLKFINIFEWSLANRKGGSSNVKGNGFQISDHVPQGFRMKISKHLHNYKKFK